MFLTYEEWLTWKLRWSPWQEPPTKDALREYEQELRGLYEEGKQNGWSPFGEFAKGVPERSQ